MANWLTGLPEVGLKRYESSKHCPYRHDPDAPMFNGSFAVVSRYLDTHGRQFAVKQIAVSTDIQRTSSADIHQAIKSEIGILSICDHPNLLRLIEAYTVDTINATRDTVFLVTLPWAPQNLGHFLETIRTDSSSDKLWWNSRTSFERCRAIFSGLLSGLGYLHKHNIMHKDIKPENILLKDLRPILADFGISKLYRVAATTHFTKSTVQYLAPEQISHIESTPRADIFALGCCFLLTYAAAYDGRNAMDRILDTIFELPGSCQYGRELHRLMPIIRQIQPQPTLLMFLVRDMMMEDHQRRPGCDHLGSVLATFVKLHQDGLERPDAVEPKGPNGQVLSDLFSIFDFCAFPTCFDNTDAVCTQRILESLEADSVLDDSAELVSTISDRSDMSPYVFQFSRRITTMAHGTSRLLSFAATLDTGSEVNVMSYSTIQEIGGLTQAQRHQHSRRLIEVFGSHMALDTIQLDYRLAGVEGVHTAEFLVLPPETESFFEVLLGAKSIYELGLVVDLLNIRTD